VLGPDNFPDLIAGQTWVHPDSGAATGVSGETLMEERSSIEKWRSIDYGMYLFERAHQYHAKDATEGLKAIAFAYGYLGHMIGDGFAHSFVNEWAGGAFDYKKGGNGLFSIFSEEIRHIAVENLLDDMVARTDDDALVLRAPRKFLYEIMTEKVSVFDGSQNSDGTLHGRQVGDAGAFGGEYYKLLVNFRDTLRSLSHHENWNDSELGSWAIDAAADVHHIATLGTDLGNPIADVEQFFHQRAEIFDTVIEEWIWLNECIAQNMVWDANLEYGGGPRTPRGPIETDACKAINFEPNGSGLGSLFNGELNNAAWGFYSDPGSLSTSIDRMMAFWEVAITETIKFDPLRDLA
jgi:hypothetical protein